MAIRARYKGDGSEFLNGVPARNLTDEDYDALDTETRALVRKSDLYDVTSEAKQAEKAAAKDS